MRIQASGYDWDSGNLDKCRKHGVSSRTIEDLFTRPVMILPDAAHSAVETRLRAVGKDSAGRHVFVVFTVRTRDGRHFIRPISARYMHRKEVASYEEENPNLRE